MTGVEKPDSHKIGLEILLVLIITFSLLFLIPYLPKNRWTSSLPPIAFVYPPVAVLIIRRLDPALFGWQFLKFKKTDLKMFFRVCIVTLIPYIFVYHLWQVYYKEAQVNFHVSFFPLLFGLLFHFFIQIFVVAFPEEFFFRSYLQDRLQNSNFFKDKSWTWGKEVFPIAAILCSNGLFALSHLTNEFNVSRLLTFFPGLVFAGLWWRTRNLFYPVLYHALCNTLLYGLSPFYR